MRQLVQRFTEPLLARIPDFSADPPRRQAAIGLVASVIAHLLLLVLFALVLWLTPSKPGYQAGQEETPLEIEIVPPKDGTEAERLALTEEEKRRQVLLSKGLTKSEEKPENAEMESDQNMKAGSELPATGLLPLPSQEGRTDLSGMSFADQDIIVGATENAADSLVRAPKGNEPPPPLYKPKPLTQAQIDAANEAGPMTALPKVSAPPPTRFEDRIRPATPPPSRVVPKPGDGELVFAARKPTTPAPVTKAEPTPNRPMVDAPLTRPPMATPSPQATAQNMPPSPASPAPGFREQLEKTRIEGSISNRGRPGVNAEATPLGLYNRKMSTLIGSRWTFYAEARAEYLSKGSVRLRYKVAADGTIEDVVVLANDANRALADICVLAVRETKLPPLPPDLVSSLNGERLEITFTFDYL